ncbi:MAG: DUF4890 domain-containing protein [Prevotellaceae bacterium]|jgi:hypothetical protein|nr:DUF4890 domain-containing protein [Prevotellaceae bacterium]
MKKIITLCTAAALLLCVAVQAQPGNTPEQRAGKLTRQMDKTLKLNKTQKKKVAEINLTYVRKVEELSLRQEGLITDEYRENFLRLVAERNWELKAVLSASQYNTYMGYDVATKKQLQEERRKERKEKRKKQQKTDAEEK